MPAHLPREDAPAEAGRPPTSNAFAEVQQRLAYDRTYLANERTYAAWLRTGLAIAAGGIAVAHLVPEPSRDSWIALGLGSVFVLAGASVMTYGAREFATTTEALQRESGRAAPVPVRLPYLLTIVLSAMLLAVLLFLWTHQGRIARDGAGDGKSAMRVEAPTDPEVAPSRSPASLEATSTAAGCTTAPARAAGCRRAAWVDCRCAGA